jgi:hypothetical protein
MHHVVEAAKAHLEHHAKASTTLWLACWDGALHPPYFFRAFRGVQVLLSGDC